jgi:X-Pro dipeptidyl-peptidase (S15 family)
MLDVTAVMDRFAVRKFAVLSVVILGLVAPAAANATITSVFGTVTCTTQGAGASEGQRWCGNSAGTEIPSWDGTPIDVAVAFPAATGADNNYPVIGIYHPWGGSKILPSSAAAQRWLKQGYAVFSMSDRGWGDSCGSADYKTAPGCEHGYVHLLSRRYEVRDAQYLLGLLADEGVINPQEIAATGGSYGGGMSLQLGSLKDRVELLNGELIPWVSPKGTPLKIAATAPEYPWSDLAQSLQPNGSNLDYVAEAPYSGMLGNHEFGIEKRNWNEDLYLGGELEGAYYAPTSAKDPEANMTEWYNSNATGGPYNGKPLAVQQEEQLPIHGAYYTSLAESPAPALIENGWNDDLFPVDQSVDYYNKVRASYPNQPMELFDMDLGHNPRSASTPSTAADEKLTAAQNAWFAYYVKGEGTEPSGARGGVTAITSVCPAEAKNMGQEYKAANWASLAPGEIRLEGAAEQTIAAPGTAPKTAFTSGNVCTTEVAGENASAATYKLAAAPSEGFTIAGSSTVVGEFSTPGTNDQVIARLMDVEPSGAQQLIGRAIYRPINPAGGFTKQVFQLHPQAWKVASGHVLKLQLLVQDSTYARSSSSPQSIQVKNLELRVPTIQAPGSDGGLVQTPLPKYLPPGYTLARNVTPAVPGVPHVSSGANPSSTGMFTLSWEASQEASALTYTLEHKNAAGGWSTVASGLTSPEYSFAGASPESEGTWTYRVSASNEGPEGEFSGESAAVKVDETPPSTPAASASREPDYAGGGGWYKASVSVAFTADGDPVLADTSPGSGVNLATLSAPETFETSGSHSACGTVADNAGNLSASSCLAVQVDATPPMLEITCPASVPVGAPASAPFTASDGQSGLASEQSGSVPIDTSTAGEVTVSTTALDNVGNETTQSCSTQVGYPTPGEPSLSAGASPNADGLFTLQWTGANPLQYFGLSYTLQHRSADSGWSTVASGIEALTYEFGVGEQEGTWTYRVQGSDPAHGQTTEFSPVSQPVVVDETPPLAPTASAPAPYYAGGGGWYKESASVAFAANGDPALSDGSPGSGVNAATLSGPESFDTSGAHTACGTVADNVGNVSESGCLTVQVDAAPPTLTVSCPAMVAIGANASATVTASDGYSGLKTDPTGSVAINTSKAGTHTITRTAVSNVGLETTRSCTTVVGYYVIVKGPVQKLVVRAGEAVLLTSTARVSGAVSVKPGGALDIEGATLSGHLKASKAALLRICSAHIAGAVKLNASSGSVVIGEGTSECAANTFTGAVSVRAASAGVSIDGNVFDSSLTVTGNAGGTIVTNNTVAKSLTVTGNSGSVLDEPNEVKGKSKLQ